jgi:hypothetical protein
VQEVKNWISGGSTGIKVSSSE